MTQTDLDQWTTPNRRPDGSEQKFDIAYKDHPRTGYIGLQDHGSHCWYKNIKIKPLKREMGWDGTVGKAQVANLLPGPDQRAWQEPRNRCSKDPCGVDRGRQDERSLSTCGLRL